MKIAIIEDENDVRRGVRLLLEYNFPSFSFVEASGVNEGFEVITQYQPDLIFLDIKMSDGTGFDLLHLFKNRSFEVIFLTAYDSYALDAFKANAINYLLKPVDPEELKLALQKAEKGIRLKKADAENVGNDSLSNKIMIKDQSNIHVINPDEIIFCQADGNYTTLFLSNRPKLVTSKKLKQFEQLLPNNFFRTHHSYIVNLNRLKKIEKKDGMCALMNNGDLVPISVRKKDRLLELMKDRFL